MPATLLALHRRVHQMKGATSGNGTKLPIWNVRSSVAIGGKADNICRSGPRAWAQSLK